jgi:hypothetical protein
MSPRYRPRLSSGRPRAHLSIESKTATDESGDDPTRWPPWLTPVAHLSRVHARGRHGAGQTVRDRGGGTGLGSPQCGHSHRSRAVLSGQGKQSRDHGDPLSRTVLTTVTRDQNQTACSCAYSQGATTAKGRIAVQRRDLPKALPENSQTDYLSQIATPSRPESVADRGLTSLRTAQDTGSRCWTGLVIGGPESFASFYRRLDTQ